MLSDIYAKLGLDGEIDSAFIKSAIYSDNTWGIKWKYSGIPFEDNDEPKEVSEVGDILDMWGFIEDSYQKLSKEEKATVEQKASPLGKNPMFRGFDGNNETSHMSIAEFLINDLGRFHKFKGRELNSHCPSIDRYRRMYQAFEPIRSNLSERLLNTEELIELLNAQVHPANR